MLKNTTLSMSHHLLYLVPMHPYHFPGIFLSLEYTLESIELHTDELSTMIGFPKISPTLIFLIFTPIPKADVATMTCRHFPF